MSITTTYFILTPREKREKFPSSNRIHKSSRETMMMDHHHRGNAINTNNHQTLANTLEELGFRGQLPSQWVPMVAEVRNNTQSARVRAQFKTPTLEFDFCLIFVEATPSIFALSSHFLSLENIFTHRVVLTPSIFFFLLLLRTARIITTRFAKNSWRKR